MRVAFSTQGHNGGTLDLGKVLVYLYGGDPEMPPPPFPECGIDPSRDALSCDAYPACEE